MKENSKVGKMKEKEERSFQLEKYMKENIKMDLWKEKELWLFQMDKSMKAHGKKG